MTISMTRLIPRFVAFWTPSLRTMKNLNPEPDTTPMSESLTPERLTEIEGYTKDYRPDDYLSDDDILSLISMARRCLSAEERLEKAVEALRLLHDFQNGCPLPSYEKHWNEAMEKVEKILEECEGTPKELRPHQECAPSVGTDVPPAVCNACGGRGGWEGGFHGETWNNCPICNP
jgi:hypothetical protein